MIIHCFHRHFLLILQFPENERLTFYEKKEKKKKPEKSNQSSKSKKKNETNSDLYVLTNAEPSFFHNGNHSDDF